MIINTLATGKPSTIHFCFLITTHTVTVYARDLGVVRQSMTILFCPCCGSSDSRHRGFVVFDFCNNFFVDALGDHVCTCTAHSGAKKTHDWAVTQLADLFRTTTKFTSFNVSHSRGQRCGDIELTAFLLADAAGPTYTPNTRPPHCAREIRG